MKRIPSLLALLLSLLAAGTAAWVSWQVYEGIPHIEDEIAFVWQARVAALGKLTTPAPQTCPRCWLVPFVVEANGLRFGKYPPGWPVVLAAGEGLAQNGLPIARSLVNPLLSGLTVWLLYRLIQKLLGGPVALLAVFLTVTSPFFLMNAGSLLSHPLTLLLATVLCLGWLDAFTAPNERLPQKLRRTLPLVVGALSLGLLALTRPLTAVGVALPFGIHGLMMVFEGSKIIRVRLLAFALIAGSVAGLLLLWQWAMTGSPWTNPYTLWWRYDTVGFGPGVGRWGEHGYMPWNGFGNMLASLRGGSSDLFGWPWLSWIFLPFGLYAIRHNRRALLVSAVLPSLIITYFLYWIGSWLYGPRYYYEGLMSAVLLTAAGIRWAVGKNPDRRWRVRFGVTVGIVMLLVACNLRYYLPVRLNTMKNLYGVSRDCQQIVASEAVRSQAPALIIVHSPEDWTPYGCLLDLQSPVLDSDFIFVLSQGEKSDLAVIESLPDRRILHYYPDDEVLLDFPRTGSE